MSNLKDLVTYHIRTSKRVKHIQWRFTPLRGLELIVPPHFKTEKANYYFEQHRAWIEKIVEKHKLHVSQTIHLPDKIQLIAFEQAWLIRYVPTCFKKVKLYHHAGELVLTCSQNTLETGKKLLQKWLNQQAHRILIPILDQLSQQTHLHYEKISFRRMSSRWGSCDKKKSLSLNVHLLFLPLPLIHHVMIHELCHLKHMNHSERFWSLVAKFDANYLQHRKSLKSAHQFVPGWAL